VMTIHDLIHLRFPQYFKAKVQPYYATVVRLACRRAARVITDDERTIEDLVELLGVEREKVRVIPLGVGENFSGPVEPYAAPRPYLLNVGNHRTHKNLATLFEAWSSLPQAVDVDLYLTGTDDFDGDLQRRSTPSRRIVALGDVSVERLTAYYAGARALVQPALREGFGLPMLEAMAVGCPVAASEDAVPRALARGALAFAPHDVRGLRELLERLVSDEGLRAATIDAGRKIARELTWDRCAQATAEVYHEVLAR
jgi:glycosyltransferase involved in cell wall biosynthesis